MNTLYSKFLPSIWLFLFFVALYFLSMGGHLYSADNEVKGLITEAIVERHSVSLPRIEMMYMTPGRDGLSYSPFPIGTSITMIPFYLVGDGVAHLFPSVPREIVIEFSYSTINSIVTALTCVILFATSRLLGFSPRTSIYTSLIYGLCTIAWPYSKTSWSEPQATLCALIGLYGGLRYTVSRKLFWMVLAGAISGYGLITKYEIAIQILLTYALVLYCFVHSRTLPWKLFLKISFAFGTPLLLAGSIILYYNYLRFDSFFAFSHYTATTVLHMQQSSPILDSLEGIIVGVYQHLFSTGKGILLFSPPLLLFYWAIKALWPLHRPLALFSIALPTLFFLLAGSAWHVSFMAWGERFLFSLTPFLILPLSALIAKIVDQKELYMKKSLVFLIASGACVQILGVAVSFQTTLDKMSYNNDTIDVQSLSYDPEYSPVLLHFKEMVDRMSKVGDLIVHGSEYLINEKDMSTEETLLIDPRQKRYRDLIRFNIFDLWFLYMYFLKLPVALILIPLCLISTTIFISVKQLRHYLKMQIQE